MILVTGAAGLAGSNLVRSLLERGLSIRVLVYQDRKAIAGLDVETVTGDVRDLDGMIQVTKGIEVVYHLAAEISLEMNSWAQVNAINVIGTHNLVEACLRRGVRRLVYFSSIHALRQEPMDQPVDEKRPLVDTIATRAGKQALPPYDLSKAMGEREIRAGIAKGLDAVILNPTGMLGPHDYKPSFFGQAILWMAKGKLPGLVTGGFDWVDARDVADGAIRAEQLGACGAKYILGGEWRSLRDVCVLVAEYTGIPAPLITAPMFLAEATMPIMERWMRFRGGPPLFTRVSLRALRGNRRVSHALAEKELGYRARPLMQTIWDALNWFMDNGYIR